MSSTELGKGCKETKTEKQTQRDMSTQRQSDKETERGSREGERGRKWDLVQSKWESQGERLSTPSAKTHEKCAVPPLFTEPTSAPSSKP